MKECNKIEEYTNLGKKGTNGRHLSNLYNK